MTKKRGEQAPGTSLPPVEPDFREYLCSGRVKFECRFLRHIQITLVEQDAFFDLRLGHKCVHYTCETASSAGLEFHMRNVTDTGLLA